MTLKKKESLEKIGDNNNLCYHCGLPVKESTLNVVIKDEPKAMCCSGCQAVAEAILASGMESYYEFRETSSLTAQELVPEFLKSLQAYDHPKVQQQFVHYVKKENDTKNIKETSLILEGIVCAACVWLNEQYLSQLSGVKAVKINYSTHRALVQWDDDIIQLSEILAAISRIGYLAHPYDVQKQQEIYDKQRTLLLKELGVAALFGMQVMMFAVALYGGDYWGISDSYKILFQWLSLFLTMPVLFFSAKRFYKGAMTDLSNKRAGMDVPVTLGISLAFIASVYNTYHVSGHVYFDSVCMFVFLLLSVRYIELTARKKSAETLESLSDLTPSIAHKINRDGSDQVIPIVDLEIGDKVLIKAGEGVPADGVLINEKAYINESLLTGESNALLKLKGDRVIAGSINTDQSIQISVTQIGQDTVLSGILRLIENAQLHKPRIALLADQIAAKFVVALIILVIATGIYWINVDASQALEIMIATLVVTCPCALSLATPAAVSASIGASSQLGVLVAKTDALEALPKVDVFVFDKTGTLTQANISIKDIIVNDDSMKSFYLALAQTLEERSEHPIAQAFQHLGDLETSGFNPAELKNIQQTVAKGIKANYQNDTYYVGSKRWLKQVTGIDSQTQIDKAVYLFNETDLLATFTLEDPLKSDAKQLIEQLTRYDKRIVLVSGDQKETVENVANQLGIAECLYECTPDEKLAYLQDLQKQGLKVAMVGDGINDAPSLAAADVAISMSHGTDIASAASDLIVKDIKTQPIVDVYSLSVKMNAVIKQNFAWAIGYNVFAIPFAVSGYVAPWLAAIGMSLSSLVVVVNAMRLKR